MKESWRRRRANGSTPTPTEQVDPDPFKCPKCPKAFHTEPALRMHHVRKHSGKGWNTAGNFKGKSNKRKSAPEQLVNFCPCCGCNIKNVALAVNFGNTP
jgi:hypothetical protein